MEKKNLKEQLRCNDHGVSGRVKGLGNNGIGGGGVGKQMGRPFDSVVEKGVGYFTGVCMYVFHVFTLSVPT